MYQLVLAGVILCSSLSFMVLCHPLPQRAAQLVRRAWYVVYFPWSDNMARHAHHVLSDHLQVRQVLNDLC